ncbi:MAG: SDR family oxidoreductase [SAR202 cluster bacterium]|nr:SDR family oxidoreductase [SAR202 cluster bacterium]
MGALDNKAVVVTGAGNGLGRAYAIAIASECGRVVVNDIDARAAEKVVTEITEAGGKAVPNVGDIADWNAAGRLIEQCVGEFGVIDVLLNNAGIYHTTPIWEETRDAFRKTLEVNVTGTFNTTRHAVERMIPRKRGSIINVSSGAQSGIWGMSVYAATKGAVASFTYALALELAAYNIRVNALSPLGATRGTGQRTGRPPLSPPENNAPMALFLASDLSENVTGQVIRMEGSVLSLFSHPKPSHPVVLPQGWTFDDMRRYFSETIGQHLEPVGIRAARYEYGGGLVQGSGQVAREGQRSEERR